MPAPFNARFALLVLLILPGQAGHAAPSADPPARPPAASSVPDYGGKESAMPAIGTSAPDPAASAARALEALVVVLAGVGVVVYGLKRFHLVKSSADGGGAARIAGPVFGRMVSPKDSAVTVVSSQSLPGGAMLHVVRVGERNLLLAATAQSVTNITEWDTPNQEAAALSDDFENYLTRADPNPRDPASGIAAANARLRSLLSRQPEEPS